MKQDALEVMKNHPLFAWMTSSPLEWLVKHGEEKSLKKDETIFFRNSPADALFLVLEGSVVFTEKDKDDISVSQGEAFGHGSLIEIRQRPREARMAENGRLLILNHSTLLQFAREFPDPYSILITNLARMLAARIRDLNEKKASRPYISQPDKKPL